MSVQFGGDDAGDVPERVDLAAAEGRAQGVADAAHSAVDAAIAQDDRRAEVGADVQGRRIEVKKARDTSLAGRTSEVG